jgi:hypothetical protein
MKKTLKSILILATIATAIAVSGQPTFARGGGPANIINSPGYQRRLEESRHPLSQPDVQAVPIQQHKSRHHRHRL